ncbi:MAG: PEP-CTERM sorting domain-containing protein [Chthoniobacterales bacterium]
MKKLLTLALAIASLTLMTAPARAQYATGDLMMGFETGNGMDVLLDLGSAQTYVTATAPFSINIGNLNSALITAFGASPGTNANIFTAVFGNLNRVADGGPGNDPSNTLYSSQPHVKALSGSSQSSISTAMSSVESEYNNEFMGGLAIVQDSTQMPNTYFSKVVGGKVFSNYITEAQFSLNNLTLDRVFSTTNGGGATQNLGTFNFAFDGSGNVTGATFLPVPEPSTYALGLLGIGIVAVLAKRRASARTV